MVKILLLMHANRVCCGPRYFYSLLHSHSPTDPTQRAQSLRLSYIGSTILSTKRRRRRATTATCCIVIVFDYPMRYARAHTRTPHIIILLSVWHYYYFHYYCHYYYYYFSPMLKYNNIHCTAAL